MTDQLPANPLARHADDAQKYRRPQSHTEGGYLKFNGKTGEWTIGTEEVEVTECLALVNALTIEHGYMRWGELPPVKAFTPDWTPYPDKPEPIEGEDMDGKPKTFNAEEARQLRGKFWGEDEDLGQFTFNTSSMGGVENVDDLFDKMYMQAQQHPDHIYPRVKLTSEWYKRSTGKVYKPVFEIVAWCDQNGEPLNAAKKLEETEAKKQTAKAPEQEQEDDSAEDDAPPRRRRRRRTA